MSHRAASATRKSASRNSTSSTTWSPVAACSRFDRRPASSERPSTISAARASATMLGSRTIMGAVEEASERCTKAGKQPIRAEQLPSAPDARMQVDLKRVDAYLGDFPALVVHEHAVSRQDTTSSAATYILTPYITSWGFAKNRTGLRDAMQKALQAWSPTARTSGSSTSGASAAAALPEITINLPSCKRPRDEGGTAATDASSHRPQRRSRRASTRGASSSSSRSPCC